MKHIYTYGRFFVAIFLILGIASIPSYAMEYQDSFWVNAPHLEQTQTTSPLYLANMEPAAGSDFSPEDLPGKTYSTELSEYKDYTLFRLTPDKIKIVELDREPDSVIVGNDQHLSIFFDTERRAALVPRQPGSSFFQIYDAEGQIIVQGHAIVAAPDNDYVRIRRTCANGSEGCQTTSVYFCPGLCHQVMLPQAQAASVQSDILGSAQGASQMASGASQQPQSNVEPDQP